MLTASVRTADLHKLMTRHRTFEGLSRLAATHGLRLLGSTLRGARLTGDLAGDVVEIAWDTEVAQ